MNQIVKRNLTLYFRDRVSVFFSLLAVMINFLLYIFIFRDLYGTSLFNLPDIREITDAWAIGGMLAAPTVTTPLGALCVLVNDRNLKKYQDFYTSPISRSKITGGYLCSSYIIGVIMTCALLVVAQIYLLINGGEVFSLTQIIQIIAVILLSTLSGAGMVLFLVALFPSGNAYTGISLVLGTLMGFISGNYMPIGLLPDFAQWIIKLSPAAHTAALFRQIIVKEPIESLIGGFGDKEVSAFMEYMGIEFSYGEYSAPAWLHVAVLAVTGVLFYALAISALSRKKK